MSLFRLACALFLMGLFSAVGCGGGGQYGYDREYVPLGDEDDWMEQSTEVSYEEVKRDPADYRSTTVAWFGIVRSAEIDASTGAATVAVTFRTHQPRHLCADERSSSCRVTVSERAGGEFTISLNAREGDRQGPDRIAPGSLVKVYGSPNGDFDADGGPVIAASWYRHWPRGSYVTTGAAVNMRR